VVAIMLVIAAFATPYMVNVTANVRLRGGMTSLAGVFQDCRAVAIKQNRLMSAHFTVVARGPVAYVKDATISSPTLASTDPQAELGAPVTQVSSLTGVTGAPTALDSTYLNYTPETGNPDVTFNPRGLPCLYASASNCAPNKGFVYYFTDTRPLGKNGWAAVTISPAGRVKVWMWNGSSWGS
jgi:Tfp pilus assembly protein FimT